MKTIFKIIAILWLLDVFVIIASVIFMGLTLVFNLNLSLITLLHMFIFTLIMVLPLSFLMIYLISSPQKPIKIWKLSLK